MIEMGMGFVLMALCVVCMVQYKCNVDLRAMLTKFSADYQAMIGEYHRAVHEVEFYKKMVKDLKENENGKDVQNNTEG